MKNKILYVIVIVCLIESSRAVKGDPMNCSSVPSWESGIQRCAEGTDGNPTQYPANCNGGFYYVFITSDTSSCTFCP